MTIDADELRFTDDGLIPAVVQDATTGTVLMLGWMNREALRATERSGLVHFWSRSRSELWQKGETSGHVLRLAGLAVDCDGDALLVLADPAGPTCHTGTTSCFDTTLQLRPLFHQLGALWTTIGQRASSRPPGSYTTRLLDGGVDVAARKVTEEATEVLMAAKDHAQGSSPQAFVAETADLLYHLLVLLAERGVAVEAVMEELQRRAS